MLFRSRNQKSNNNKTECDESNNRVKNGLCITQHSQEIIFTNCALPNGAAATSLLTKYIFCDYFV